MSDSAFDSTAMPTREVIVLLPGLDGTGRLFAPFLRALPPTLSPRVVAYPAAERLGYAELHPFAARFLPAEGPVVLVAESFSGPIAIELAAALGERVRALVLVASFARNPFPALAPLRRLTAWLPGPLRVLGVLSFFLLGREATPELRAALREALGAVEPAVLRHRLAAVLTVDASAALRSLRCPVLYLEAADDRVVPRRAALEVQRLCPHAEVRRLPGPHLLLQARPGAAVEAIRSFLD